MNFTPPNIWRFFFFFCCKNTTNLEYFLIKQLCSHLWSGRFSRAEGSLFRMSCIVFGGMSARCLLSWFMNLNLCFCFSGGGGVHSFHLMSSLRAGSCHWNRCKLGVAMKATRNVVLNLLMCVCLCVWGSVAASAGVFFGDFFFLSLQMEVSAWLLNSRQCT